MSNMCASPDIIKILEGENDKLKYLVLSASDEDEEIIKASGGALCMVLSASEKCIPKVFEVRNLLVGVKKSGLQSKLPCVKPYQNKIVSL